jgi:hypothetical protein
MNKEFIIKYEMPEEAKKLPKKIIWAGIPFLGLVFSLLFYSLYSLTRIQLPFAWKNVFILSFLNFLLKIASFGLIAFFGSGILFALYALISLKINNVLGVVNEQGLKLKYYNFIPWEYVDKIETYQSKNSPMAPVQLALWIRLDKEIRKHLSIGAKMGIFWSKITGYQHITFGSMDSEENLRILEFAQECLKKH